MMTDANLPQSGKKSSAKFILTAMGLGVVITLALVSIYFPRLLTWYIEPPMANGVSCAPTVQWVVDKILMAQLFAVLVGGVIGLWIGARFARKSS
jgi:uncharacterized membrane protein YfcA